MKKHTKFHCPVCNTKKQRGSFVPWDQYRKDMPLVEVCLVCAKHMRKCRLKDMNDVYRSKIEFHCAQILDLKELVG